LQVDFANKYLGGGVLGQGCVQEEIMFAVCPELVVGMLFEEVMNDSEAIVISGYERFCSYRGYGHSFAYDSDFRDQCSNQNVVVAIDAIPFRYV
jgi:poly(ADP-ribose) glycohydrolase